MHRMMFLLITAAMLASMAHAQDVIFNCEFVSGSNVRDSDKDDRRIIVNEQQRTASFFPEDDRPGCNGCYTDSRPVFASRKVTWSRRFENTQGNYSDTTYDLSRETAKLVWDQTWRNGSPQHRVYQCTVSKGTIF